MITRTRRAGWGAALGLTVLVAGTAACGSPTRAAAPEPAVAAAQAAPAEGLIEHRVPRRDFVGQQPAQFAWTAVPDADHYAIGIWNEVDRLIWRKDDITGTSVDRPAELDLEEGTYFWTVSALRGTQEIAKSGLAAFVVEK